MMNKYQTQVQPFEDDIYCNVQAEEKGSIGLDDTI